MDSSDRPYSDNVPKILLPPKIPQTTTIEFVHPSSNPNPMDKQAKIPNPQTVTGGASNDNKIIVTEKGGSTIEQEKELDLWRKFTVYRVPPGVKELNPKAYRPQVVSFGPYHHAAGDLAAMEEHKSRALRHLLRRAQITYRDLVEGMQEITERLQESYQDIGDRWLGRLGGKELVGMMIEDGCFMIEILRLNMGIKGGYAADDPIFSKHGMLHTLPYVKRDMLIIENQLPLFLLEKIVSVETGKPANSDLINQMVLKLCSPPESPPPIPGTGLGLHPLDLYRRSLIQGPSAPPPANLPPRFRSSDFHHSGTIRSAVELYEAGIRFKPSPTASLHDIRFHHGVLSLPTIVVDDSTQYIYLNLMVFERLHVNAGSQVTSFVFFMDNIIDTAKDVGLLQKNGIIQNAVGSDKAVAKVFNSLSKDVTLDPDSGLEDVQRRVNAYCQKFWNRWRANLIHTYFTSPWAILSLAAAVFLLALSVAQTVYTILPYYNNGDSADVGGVAAPPPLPMARPPVFAPRRGH